MRVTSNLKEKNMTKTSPASLGSKKPKPGLDYTPQRGGRKDVSYGVVQRSKAGKTHTAHKVVARRLENFEASNSPPLAGNPTCARHDILLPRHAPDHCSSYLGLCNHFEAQALPHQRDLIGILTLRFEHPDTRHVIWELSREFLLEQVVRKRQLPVILALHIPSISSRPTPPHVHAMIFMRRLLGPDFADFDRELAGENAKQILAAEWEEWTSSSSQLSVGGIG